MVDLRWHALLRPDEAVREGVCLLLTEGELSEGWGLGRQTCGRCDTEEVRAGCEASIYTEPCHRNVGNQRIRQGNQLNNVLEGIVPQA